ncbi:MAG TPA: DUF3656 domain-containing protein [Candidatus Limnocylindria bacterium]|nr:DUF3656 domain-containing protein [Candidatus Limnocylindria bacterium]
MSARLLPELLAPAGDWECVRAAVENGADAIYFGLDRFNARMRAHNFTEADLPGVMEFLHHRGVRGYVTFNTLVFTEELPAAESYIRSIIAAGVDAAIVQDVGICRLIRQISPDFPIHASTQMTVTSPEGVAFAQKLGCNLVVLARENSIKDISAIQQQLTGPASLPLEVFVHGALCVAYSGQCLTSEALGGRSANRGECAQACRMPYELLADGRTVELGQRRYLLSPQDLAGLEVLPELARAGVRSLKIEGRLKAPEYVAAVTRIYRQALDRLGVELGLARFTQSSSVTLPNTETAVAATGFHVEPKERYELEMAFSRGLSTGWFKGINNQELVHARFGKKRGVLLGDIDGVQGQALLVKLQAPLKPGDGVVIDGGIGDDNEQGGRVYSVHSKGALTQICFRPGQIQPRLIKRGDKVWKTDDPEFNKQVRQTFEGQELRSLRPINFEVHGVLGSPLTLIARDEQGRISKASSKVALVAAERHPLNEESLRSQLGRLGNTPFALSRIDLHLEGQLMLPMSELNRLRRDVVAELERLRRQPIRWQLIPRRLDLTPTVSTVNTSAVTAEKPSTPELIVLVRSLAQLDAAIAAGIRSVYCDFEDPKKYRDAVSKFRETAGGQGEIWVAPPRVFKPGEEWILKIVRSSEATGYLVRNYNHLAYFADCRRRGDFSLNVANPLAARYFVEDCGLERVTASYDLNAEQLEALLRAGPKNRIEITLHQHMPMFHMEHCVFCAFLSSGTDYTNCGRPCEKVEVRLRDRVGMEHALKADSGCRNTVFHARAQTGAEFLDRFRAAGLPALRIEFVNETAAEVTHAVDRYRALLRGEIAGGDLWRELRVQNQLGVTRGQLEHVEVRKVFPRNSPARAV